jgi:SWI/SNF-related matrix-associated actin-dependent regulator 1 of chromatin subfamily A
MGTLYTYQEEGVDFLAGSARAYLADTMGLGKTVQAAVAAARLRLRRVLVIGPASSLENWRREWATWGPTPCIFRAISYANPALHDGEIDGGDWDAVILDEAHYLKNARAKRTHRALNVARGAGRAWLLSGTPMPNNPGELWAPLRALWPQAVARTGCATYFEWFNHFCHWSQTRYGPRAYGVKNVPELRDILSGVMLRRRLEDVALDLPPLRVESSLLPQDSAFAAALEAAGVDPDNLEAAIRTEETEEDGSTSRLRHLLGRYKAPLIGDLIARELDDKAYGKIVVLAYHRDVLSALRDKLQPFGVVGFDGSTPQVRRQEAIDVFTTQPGYRVFLAQQGAAGIAINLQAAHELVLVEPAWTPDENMQAIKRIHRIGQDSPSRARIFAVANSLDEAIMSTVATKLRMQRELGL